MFRSLIESIYEALGDSDPSDIHEGKKEEIQKLRDNRRIVPHSPHHGAYPIDSEGRAPLWYANKAGTPIRPITDKNGNFYYDHRQITGPDSVLRPKHVIKAARSYKKAERPTEIRSFRPPGEVGTTLTRHNIDSMKDAFKGRETSESKLPLWLKNKWAVMARAKKAGGR